MTPVRATIIVNKNPGNAVTRAGANRNRSSYTRTYLKIADCCRSDINVE